MRSAAISAGIHTGVWVARSLGLSVAIVTGLLALSGCALLPGPEEFLLYPPGFSTEESPLRGEWILVSSTGTDSTQKRIYVRRGDTLATARETITIESYPKPFFGDPGDQMTALARGLQGPCVEVKSISPRGESDLSFQLILGCPGERKEQIVGRVIYGQRTAFQILYRASPPSLRTNVGESISDFKLSTQ